MGPVRKGRPTPFLKAFSAIRGFPEGRVSLFLLEAAFAILRKTQQTLLEEHENNKLIAKGLVKGESLDNTAGGAAFSVSVLCGDGDAKADAGGGYREDD